MKSECLHRTTTVDLCRHPRVSLKQFLFSLALRLSFPTVSPPSVLLHPISPSVSCSISEQEMFSSPRSRGLEGCTHCPRQRGHCVNPPKIQRRKRRPIKIRNPVSSASHKRRTRSRTSAYLTFPNFSVTSGKHVMPSLP